MEANQRVEHEEPSFGLANRRLEPQLVARSVERQTIGIDPPDRQPIEAHIARCTQAGHPLPHFRATVFYAVDQDGTAIIHGKAPEAWRATRNGESDLQRQPGLPDLRRTSQ